MFMKAILNNKFVGRLNGTGHDCMRTCKLFCMGFMFIFSHASYAQLTYKELRVEYDSAWTFRNLQIVPVRYKIGEGKPAVSTISSSPPLSLSEALQKRKVKLREMSKNSADPNWIKITNRSKEDVLIQTGEILDGGKQDRMIGETKVLTPGSTDYLHVYCVEKRRWQDRPKKFKAAGVANSDLQKTMNTKRRQSDVWKEIDRQFKVNNKKSETYSYLDLYNTPVIEDSDYMRYFLGRYGETDSTFAGYLFITGNRIISTELFATADLTRISFRNMLSSYVQTARSSGSRPIVTRAKQKEFMDKILTSEQAQKAYVIAHGKLQVSNGKVIHLIAYDD